MGETSPPPPSVTTEPPPAAAEPSPSEPPTRPQGEVPPPSSAASSSPAAASPLSKPVQNPPASLQPLTTQVNQPQQRPPFAGNRPQSPSLSSPAPSMVQKSASAAGLAFSTFGPSRPFNQPFTQARQSMQGIQNTGKTNSHSAGTLMRLSGVAVHHQQRLGPLGQPPTRPASPTSNPTLSFNKIQGHGLSRVFPMASSSSPATVMQSPRALQHPLVSTQGKQMASSVPSSSSGAQVKPQAMQQRSHILQHPHHSMLTTSHQQQISSLQQHQQQQQHKHQQLQLQQRLQQQQQASSLHQSQEHRGQQHLPHRNQQSVAHKQQAPQSQGSTLQKSNIPALVQSRAITPLVSSDAAESGNKIISKRSIRELFTQIDPSEKLEPEVEDALVEVADDFIESITTFACSLAKHRKSSTLEAKDILLHAERNWNIMLPGFGGDEIKCYKKQLTDDTHKERIAMIKKSTVGASEVGQAKNPPASHAAAKS